MCSLNRGGPHHHLQGHHEVDEDGEEEVHLHGIAGMVRNPSYLVNLPGTAGHPANKLQADGKSTTLKQFFDKTMRNGRVPPLSNPTP